MPPSQRVLPANSPAPRPRQRRPSADGPRRRAAREAQLNGQFEIGEAGRGPILVLISGLEGGGRGDTANKLNEWMDPRFIRTHAFGPGAPEEEARPLAWRYWRALPPRGRVGIFMNAWYRQLVAAHVQRQVSDAQFDARLQEV